MKTAQELLDIAKAEKEEQRVNQAKEVLAGKQRSLENAKKELERAEKDLKEAMEKYEKGEWLGSPNPYPILSSTSLGYVACGTTLNNFTYTIGT